MTNINDKVEAFQLDTDQGKFNSKDHIGKNLVLFFFPKADTTGCTKEAISFSNLINEFKDLNTIVIGISKDTVENLFGSFIVFIDQPFQIGDWVVIDGSIEGVVEEVGFRSTRIRAFTNSIITVPNAKITRCTVNNFGKREMRRFKCTLGLRYDTPVEKMEAYLQEVRSILENRDSIKKEAIFVYLNKMSSFSLDIMVYTFFVVHDWREELAEKEALFLAFMNAAEKVGVSFAFPTQTIELENQSPNP